MIRLIDVLVSACVDVIDATDRTICELVHLLGHADSDFLAVTFVVALTAAAIATSEVPGKVEPRATAARIEPLRQLLDI